MDLDDLEARQFADRRCYVSKCTAAGSIAGTSAGYLLFNSPYGAAGGCCILGCFCCNNAPSEFDRLRIQARQEAAQAAAEAAAEAEAEAVPQHVNPMFVPRVARVQQLTPTQREFANRMIEAHRVRLNPNRLPRHVIQAAMGGGKEDN